MPIRYNTDRSAILLRPWQRPSVCADILTIFCAAKYDNVEGPSKNFSYVITEEKPLLDDLKEALIKRVLLKR